MSGPTLCGELTEWVGDANLLNCCVEDLNEPLCDDFDTRARVESEGAWIDPNNGFLANEDLAEMFGFDFHEGSDSGDDGEDGDDDGPDEGVVVRTTLSLRHSYVSRYLAQLQQSVDHMSRMFEFGPEDQPERFSVGSTTRLPLRRTTRYSRR